jgi:hypothetical protein
MYWCHNLYRVGVNLNPDRKMTNQFAVTPDRQIFPAMNFHFSQGLKA